MADSREPPPLFDEPLFGDTEVTTKHQQVEDDEDLFQSAIETSDVKTTPTKPLDNPSSTDVTDSGEKGDIFEDADEQVSLDSPSPSDETKDATTPTTADTLVNGRDPATAAGAAAASAAAAGAAVGKSEPEAEPFKEANLQPALQKPPPAPAADPIAAAGEGATSEDTISASKSTSANEEKDEFQLDPSHYIEVTVTDPQKMGDGMGAYMAYKVKTKTNISLFSKKEFSVMRRFSDFLGIHSKLHEKHFHLGRIVPPAPEKSVMGMTKVKMSKEAPVVDEFVGRRRAALERYLNRTAQHPALLSDPAFLQFLELDSDLPKATNTAALSGAGVMRLFSKMGDSVNKMTYKMDESDQWFEEKQVQVDNLDQQLRKVHVAVETLVHNRRELSQGTGLLAKSCALLANCEEHTTLSRALSQLAELEEKVEQLEQAQGDADLYLFSELLKDYITIIMAIKEVFYQRVKVFHNWQSDKALLSKKRENEARLQLQGKTDKINQAKSEVKDYEEKVMKSEQDFDSISRTIRKEMQQFDETRVKDFKSTLVKYLECHMEQQTKLIQYWEAFLPEAEAVASK